MVVNKKKYLNEVEGISSPTVSLEDLFFTLVLDVHEWRGGTNFDVPVAYMYADIPKYKKILLKIIGYLVYIMCHINHSMGSM